MSEMQKPLLGQAEDTLSRKDEEWRDVTEWPGYQVNTKGECRRITYLKPYVDSNGYLAVGLYRNNQRGAKRLHKLVADAFIPNPDDLAHIDHLDGNKLNPALDNLERTTQRENYDRAVRSGAIARRHIPQGEEHANSKLDPDKVRYIRLNPERKTQRQLAAQFDVTQHAIACVVARETWKSEPTISTWTPPLPKGVNHGMAKLTGEKVLQIRALLAQGVFHQTIADQYGVSRPTISMISKRRIWADLA